MSLPIALLAMTAVAGGCSTLAGSDTGTSAPRHALEPVCLAAVTHGDGIVDLSPIETERLARRPGLLVSMQARALGCLD